MKKSISILAVFLLGIACAQAQWSEVGQSFVATWGTDLKAIDYDLDGDLDVYISGATSPQGNGICRIYRNEGNFTFTPIYINTAGYFKGCSAWADFNDDGNMDFVSCGRISEAAPGTDIVRLNLGNGSGGFVAHDLGWEGLYYAWAEAGDYNNDGLQDVLICGLTAEGPSTRLYRNEGNMAFTEVQNRFPGVFRGRCQFVDYDGDGDLDAYLVGNGENCLYRNEGNDIFVPVGPGFPSLRCCCSSWGDLDNDGRPDLVCSGDGPYGVVTYVYHNMGAGSFSQIPVTIPGVLESSVAWGDFNNDGFSDILIQGSFGPYGTRIVEVHLNNGNHGFYHTDVPFIPVSSGRAVCADFNGDGKLDVIYSGTTGDYYLLSIYRNTTDIANSPPQPPQVHFDEGSGTVEFYDAQDSTTPNQALTYNLRIGTSPGADDVFGVLEDTGGVRRSVGPGRKKFKFYAEPGVTYYAAAQAIDNSHAGSQFGSELAFGAGVNPLISIGEADTLFFDSVLLGSQPCAAALSIENTGISTLIISGINCFPQEGAFHLADLSFPLLIDPGSQTGIQLWFAPVAEGWHYGSLIISSNAANDPQLAVSLAGEGFLLGAPMAVEGLSASVEGQNLRLAWLPVTCDVNGHAMPADCYLVFSRSFPGDSGSAYLGLTTQPGFTIVDDLLAHSHRFYFVVAVYLERGETGVCRLPR